MALFARLRMAHLLGPGKRQRGVRPFAHKHRPKGSQMIQSFRVDIPPNEHGHVFLVMDTVANGKHLFTALGVGRIERGEPMLTNVGSATLNALMAYAEHKPAGRVHFMEIATVAAVPVRLRKILERADKEDVVFFVCRNPNVYDAAFTALNVRFDAEPAGIQ